MFTLLDETTKFIAQIGQSLDNIEFIGSNDGKYSCSWQEFTELANVEYDGGFGLPEVATDLIIVFSDGSKMQRAEYDGSEWWTYGRLFILPVKTKTIKRISGKFAGNLDNLNSDDYEA